MVDEHFNGSGPVLEASPHRRVSRRSLLQAMGFGTAAAVAGAVGTVSGGMATAQESSETEPSTIGTRVAGGPAVDEALWDLEFDTERIFRFVADEVAYEAYGGALRGAKGTHWGLAGNSVDQALLLADLLTQAQVPVRFAAGELEDGAADDLLASMLIDADTARGLAERVGTGGQVDLDKYPDLTPEQREAMRSPDGLRAELIEQAGARLDDGIDIIEAALADVDISLPVPELVLPDRERTQHVWVQYADGAEWIDLDPTVPNAEPGRAYATQTVTWDALPDDLYHLVRFRAVVEKLSGGEAIREDSFTYEARAADLVGVPVVFAHVDPSAFRDLGVTITGFIEGTLQYVPSLLVGDEGETGTPITIGGGGGVLDIFGTSESDGQAIAEWLEIEVQSPDAPPRRITREVFDRIGVDRRAAGGFDLESLPPAEITDTPELGQTFLPLEAVWLVGVIGGRVPAGYFAQDYAVPDVQADMSLLVHGYHAARDLLQVEVAAEHGYRWYHNEPNLTAAVVTPVEVADDQYRITASLDILHQGYGVVELDGERQSVHPKVLAGVLAHVAERVGADAGAALAPDSPPPAGSVSQVFEEAAKSGIQLRTFMPDADDLDALDVSDVARARIGEALAAGYVVVVPERSVELDGTDQVGWWQVDPSTGQTFDLMENGRGAAPLGENTVIIIGGPAWRAAAAWKALSFLIGIIVGFSAVMAIQMYPN